MDRKGIETVRSHGVVRRWDIVVLLIFLAVLIALIVVALMPKGDIVEVYRAGRLEYRMKLSDVGEYDILDDSGACLLTLVIDDEGASVKNAVCKDKLCEMQGHIHSNGASIVCLPSKITIVIKGDNKRVDVVS